MLGRVQEELNNHTRAMQGMLVRLFVGATLCRELLFTKLATQGRSHRG